jgi:uncharacterized membrane protein YcjF (UPF0283 family)
MDTEDRTTTAPPRPRIELEGLPAPRLEPTALVALETERREIGTVPLVLGGGAVLGAGLGGLAIANFVADQFARSPTLGGLTLAVALAGAGLMAAGVWRELRALFALRTVDRLRAELSGVSAVRARPALRAWLAGLPEGQATLEAIEAIDSLDDPAAVAALLRAGPLAALRAQSDALGRTAALQVFAAAAAVPSPALDGLLVAWRGTRLVRQIAALHGMRPGLFGTLALLRRTMLSAAGVAATDLAADSIARAVLSSPLLAHVAGDVAGAGVAARRMIVLARATAAACSPLPPG